VFFLIWGWGVLFLDFFFEFVVRRGEWLGWMVVLFLLYFVALFVLGGSNESKEVIVVLNYDGWRWMQ
jgi:hypothetical protein